MDRINQNNINSINFSGAKPKACEVKSMEEQIKKMVEKIYTYAKNDMTDKGYSPTIIEKFENPDESLVVKDFWLEIAQAPKGVKNSDIRRSLKFVASRKKSGREVEVMLVDGTKDDILNKLKDPALIDRLKESAKNLSYHLEDLL